MLHMKDDKPEPYARDLTSVVDVDGDSDFGASPASGLSPRRSARAHHKPLASARSDDDDGDVFATDGDGDGDGYDSDGKPPALKRLNSNDSVDDARFRVNGIVVDHEIPGGAKPHWEDVYQVLFQSSTPNGQRMALTLLIMVSVSVTCAVLDSVKSIRTQVGDYLLVMEVFFTIVFSIEYTLRVMCLRKPRKFMFSLLGMIDMCALVPSYLGLFIPSARPLIHLAVLRIFRVMRVFRVLRLARFVDASTALSDNIQSNKRRIAVFLVALFTMILVIGCAMYLIEGGQDFSNIPISLYWTVVTITTVGYGDIAPQTVLGRMLATVVMFAGYGLIACPLVLTNQVGGNDSLLEVTECPRCFRRKHQDDANFCRVCGTALHQPRVKTIKAQQRRLRLAKLRTPVHATRMEPMSSTTSTTKSNARLLNHDDDDDRHGITVNL